MNASTRYLPVFLVFTAACGEAGPRLSEPARLGAATEAGATPMFAVAPDGARTVAWVTAPDGGTDGRLLVSTGGATTELRDSLGPIEPHGEAPPKIAYAPDGTLYALYAVGKVVPRRRFPMSALRLAASTDGGRTWGTPGTIASDSAFGTRNFHALHAAADGALYVAWLESDKGKSGTFITSSADGGRSWATPVRVDSTESCPCCRTAIATAPDGTLYLAWRTVLPGNVRDVVVARSTDRGATWSAPVRVHADDWVFDGCPHAGPSMQVDADGRLHVAWWTGKEGSAGVYYARSDDGARSFATVVPLGVAEFSKPAHVQLAVGASGTVAVTWDDGTMRTPSVVLRLSRDGGASFAEAMRVSGEGRAATFPVLAVTGDELTVAWVEQSVDALEHAEHAKPDMKDPTAVMGLPSVGAGAVLVRSGRLE